MGQNSAIEWTDHTFNPWVGCTKVSPACDHCYAEAWAKRSGAVTWGGERKRTSVLNWKHPLRWDRDARVAGIRQRVFCASLADVFDNEVPASWRADLFRLIRSTPNLDWLLLTKRIGNAAAMIERALVDGHLLTSREPAWPWPNVWLGATVVNQEEADRDVPKLLQVPARGRFLSIEPMLGPVDLSSWPDRCYLRVVGNDGCATRDRIDWVIAGGESGPGARPAQRTWIRALRDQCISAGVPFLFKQWGEWVPGDQTRTPAGDRPYGSWTTDGFVTGLFNLSRLEKNMKRVGKKIAGRTLDGATWSQLPNFEVGHEQTSAAP